MNSPLRYCPNCPEVLARLRRFYDDRSQEIILAWMRLPRTALKEFAEHHPAGLCGYPDPHERIRFWDAYLRESALVDDDEIPSAYLSEMDQGLYCGLLGGEMQFQSSPDWGWISSMTAPLIGDWSELERLAFNPDHPWFRRYLEQLDIFVEGARGKFGISHFILINHLNFIFELVGASRAYLDMFNEPEMIRRGMDLAYEINRRIHDAFFERAPLLEGGTCSNFAQWIPGRIVSESVDPFTMTSVDCFESWGREPIERIFAAYDGGVIHIHANGRHMIEAVAGIKGIKAMVLVEEKDYPPPLDGLAEYKRRAGDVPLIVHVDFARFDEALRAHRLPGGVFYWVNAVPDVEQARRCMERVREYSR